MQAPNRSNANDSAPGVGDGPARSATASPRARRLTPIVLVLAALVVVLLLVRSSLDSDRLPPGETVPMPTYPESAQRVPVPAIALSGSSADYQLRAAELSATPLAAAKRYIADTTIGRVSGGSAAGNTAAAPDQLTASEEF